ncbi:putative leucine-rich repeat-containing protein DDB_G0290503 [Oscarella lobularis]|uniref:putative leucine-rich repeat-containing protein DDB_G0290503 n=1 Tax=Oscarella lobularis TaxID=121494 RepID=UPI00331333CF
MSASEGKLESGFDLRVGNLSEDVRKNDVLRHVEKKAKVSSINHYALTWKDKRQGRTTGYAFLHFPNDEEAERAERALSGTMFSRRPLLIARVPCRSKDAANVFIRLRASVIVVRRGEYQSGTASPAPAEPSTEKMSLIITSVETNCSFWAQMSNDESKLQQLQKCLKSWGPKTAAVQIPDVEQIYGPVFEEDSNWYRCKLIQSEAGMDKVVYIDYGNELEIESVKLVVLPESYSQISAYARRYFLTGIQIEETHSEEVYEMLKSMSGDVISSQCYFTPCDIIPCMLFSRGNNVANQLIERGHAHKLDLTAFAVLRKVMWEREIFRNEIKREKRSKALLQTQMQNIIPEKFNKLADLLAELPSLRRSVKKHLDLLEKAYQVLVNREEVIDPDHMTTLKEVEEKLNVFKELQQKIGCCDDKSSLESMIKSRDESHLHLVNSLQIFLNVVSLMSMDERHQKLQETKDLLLSFSKGWNRIVDPAPTLETALNQYQQWKVSCTKEFESLPEKTDELVHKLKTSMTSWVNSRDSESEASEEFRFALVSEILQWLVRRYDPNAELPMDTDTEQDCVLFIKSVAQFIATKAHIKLNGKKLYGADGYAVKELLKIASMLYDAMGSNQNDRPGVKSAIIEQFDITGKTSDLKLVRQLASEITEHGSSLSALLKQEVELQEMRVAVIARSLELDKIVRALKTSTSNQVHGKTRESVHRLENLAGDEANLEARIEKKKQELERNQKRLKSLQNVIPAFMDEYEKLEAKLKRHYEEYIERFRNLTFREHQLKELNRIEQEKLEATNLSLQEMQRNAHSEPSSISRRRIVF